MDDSLGNFEIVQGFEDSLSLRTAQVFHKSEYPALVKGKTFAFKTRVANQNGWSEFSDTTYVKVAEVPERPRAPELVQASATEMQLKLFKPEDNGGSDITKLELYINDGDAETEPSVLVSTYTDNTLSHTLYATADNLEAGTVYKLKLRAYNSVGQSKDSDIIQYALVDAPPKPDAPTGLFSLTSDQQVAVQWSAVTTTQAPG